MNERYTKMLSPAEHSAAFNSGMSIVLASARLSGDAELVKDAQGVGDALRNAGMVGDMGTRLLVAASLMTGIPVGIVAHVVAKRIGEERAKEKSLQDEIGYYTGATSGLEREMARQGLK